MRNTCRKKVCACACVRLVKMGNGKRKREKIRKKAQKRKRKKKEKEADLHRGKQTAAKLKSIPTILDMNEKTNEMGIYIYIYI